MVLFYKPGNNFFNGASSAIYIDKNGYVYLTGYIDQDFDGQLSNGGQDFHQMVIVRFSLLLKMDLLTYLRLI